ncbi:hypothetical protein HWQ46_26140 [Shewanella sp. D64]|uniref:phage terminase small subunit n=1 Tax=unclassified Shewanella TaxID=196818 RepID=UPI0022BA5F58|nr:MULTISPECIES: phage terminase small subunit [unclassified Shewanella]MEC4728997.1 hypothetical protein [Shewanella sp. D64]MEC4740023.1 hypothetical protein [Shewanella sp. E94]WBJ94379.1 hypothetical protein HWQ47_21300 [Shewanella sp. MTB7]
MLTLLKKRLARAKAKAALEEASHPPHEEVELPVVTGEVIHDPLQGKPWDEVQRMLDIDLDFVRTLAGFDEKNAFRKELIKKYQATVVNLLATKESLEGLDLVWWHFLWQVDCGSLDVVHNDFKAAVLRGLSAPKRWNSNGQTAFCDIVFKYSHSAHTEKVLFNPTFLLGLVNDITQGKLAVNAPLKVKIFRLAGDLMDQQGEKKVALSLFTLVMEIDPNRGGRKTRVQELTVELKGSE